MKIAAFAIFTLFTIAGHPQNTINGYKYVLVPQKFVFSKTNNEYGLNATTKSLLEQKGFTVFWSDADLPQAVADNKCAALKAEVTERKATFSTNLTLVLKDCLGNIIFKSKEGKSLEKEYNVAYDEALREAFASLNNVPYKYDSTLAAQTAAQAQQPTPSSTTSPPAPVSPQPAVAGISGTLYAQAIPNGYQLIDTTPKKVLTLFKTSVPDCFLAETVAGASNGIVFKKNGEWFSEYYKDGVLVSQKLEIKF
jgi:hypothetical protein